MENINSLSMSMAILKGLMEYIEPDDGEESYFLVDFDDPIFENFEFYGTTCKLPFEAYNELVSDFTSDLALCGEKLPIGKEWTAYNNIPEGSELHETITNFLNTQVVIDYLPFKDKYVEDILENGKIILHTIFNYNEAKKAIINYLNSDIVAEFPALLEYSIRSSLLDKETVNMSFSILNGFSLDELLKYYSTGYFNKDILSNSIRADSNLFEQLVEKYKSNNTTASMVRTIIGKDDKTFDAFTKKYMDSEINGPSYLDVIGDGDLFDKLIEKYNTDEIDPEKFNEINPILFERLFDKYKANKIAVKNFNSTVIKVKLFFDKYIEYYRDKKISAKGFTASYFGRLYEGLNSGTVSLDEFHELAIINEDNLNVLLKDFHGEEQKLDEKRFCELINPAKAKANKSPFIKNITQLPVALIIHLAAEDVFSNKNLQEVALTSQSFYNAIITLHLPEEKILRLMKKSYFADIIPNENQLRNLYDLKLLSPKGFLEVAKAGRVGIQSLIDVYSTQDSSKPSTISEKEMREYFTVQKIFKLVKEGKTTPKIIEFYQSYVITDDPKIKKAFENELSTIIAKEIPKEEVVEFTNGLISLGLLSKLDITKLSQQERTDLFLKEEINPQDLFVAFNSGNISIYEMIDYFSPNELLQNWATGLLIDGIFEVISYEDIQKGITEGYLSKQNVFTIYTSDFANIQVLKDGNLSSADIADNIGTFCTEELQKNKKKSNRSVYPASKLSELVENELLCYNDFKELVDKKLLVKADYDYIYSSFTNKLLSKLKNGNLTYNELEDLMTRQIISPEMFEKVFIDFKSQLSKALNDNTMKYDNLKELAEKAGLPLDAVRAIEDSYEIEKVLTELRKMHQIQNTSIPEGHDTGPNSLYSVKSPMESKAKISPETRQKFFQELGAEKPIPISGGGLDGYDLVAMPQYNVAILEKSFNRSRKGIDISEAVYNATFVIPLIKALQLAHESNKADLNEERNVKRINHVATWGKNAIKAISDVGRRLNYRTYCKDSPELASLVNSIVEEYTRNTKGEEK